MGIEMSSDIFLVVDFLDKFRYHVDASGKGFAPLIGLIPI